MLAGLIKTVLPGGFSQKREDSSADRYSLYLAQQSAHHHFDSLCLAVGVLEFDNEPAKQAEWLLRIAEGADKCVAAINECTAPAEHAI